MLQTTKTQEIRAKLNPTEKAALAAIAQAEVLNLSETIRALVREGARLRGLWPPTDMVARVNTKEVQT